MLVILRSPALWDDEGSQQFAANPSTDGLHDHAKELQGFFGPQRTGASE
jgi:hypothetical protein